MAKRYPTVQEMVGFFQGLSEQSLRREQLELEKTQAKAYGDYMSAQIVDMQQQRDLLKAQQEALASYRADQQLLERLRLEQTFQEEQRAAVETALDFATKQQEAQLANMSPGTTETAKDFMPRYSSLYQSLTALGLNENQKFSVLSNVRPLHKPEEKATIGQKLDFATKLPGLVSKEFAGELSKTLGTLITPEMFEKVKSYSSSQLNALGFVLDMAEKDRIPPGVGADLLNAIEEGDLKKVVSTTFLPEKHSMTDTGYKAAIEAYQQDAAMKAEITAKKMEQDTGLSYRAVRDSGGWGGIAFVTALPYEEAKDRYRKERVSIEDLQKFPEYYTDPDFKTDVNAKPTLPQQFKVTR